jgi:hypothetical protein
MSETGIRVVPKTDNGNLQGFVVKGRRPDNILEWAHTTLALAHFAVSSEFSIFRRPTFLAVHDNPLRLLEDVLLDVPVVEVGVENIDRDTFGAFALGAAVVRVEKELAVGALLFPGAPHIGIGHVASVVHIDVEGNVHRMITDDNASTTMDPDIAVLSSLLLNEY